MRNLDQIRAAAATRACTEAKFTRSNVAGFPSLVMTNGLLAATAFSLDRHPEIQAALDAMAAHLANPEMGIAVLQKIRDARQMVASLAANGSSLDLQRATAEALAFFSYVKRFAPR